MVILKRRRLYFWLLKAYFKKWGKSILLWFIIGLVAFFVFRSSFSYVVSKIPFIQHKEIGLVGAYSTDSLPTLILNNISVGLTRIDSDSTVKPAISQSWDIKDGGKTYIFKLKKQLFFSDGTLLTSDKINYGFKDVVLERPDKQTIIFKLKENYAPFLVTVSQPIYKNNFIGLGEYKIKTLKFNGNFIQTLTLESIRNKNLITYQFYPTEESLKLAFTLGEVSEISNVQNTDFRNTDLATFKNATISKKTDFSTLVSIFYNTQDKMLSDKKLRKALDYALPNLFNEGERNHTPYAPNIWVNKGEINDKQRDINKAKDLINQVKESASASAVIKIELQVLAKHEKIANEIKSAWDKLGVETNIKIVDQLPDNFQVFLGEYFIPKDPDQYSLWHSDQQNNITKYKNLRIDKLLEDGRETVDIEKRRKIYLDFQKYLIDDLPASFLINPYIFDIERK
jgi:peptide/nickel transport system substrate-binding protein